MFFPLVFRWQIGHTWPPSGGTRFLLRTSANSWTCNYESVRCSHCQLEPSRHVLDPEDTERTDTRDDTAAKHYAFLSLASERKLSETCENKTGYMYSLEYIHIPGNCLKHVKTRMDTCTLWSTFTFQETVWNMWKQEWIHVLFGVHSHSKKLSETCENKTGYMYSLGYTHIPNMFFTPHHVVHC
jgi:hypothetical protein